MPKAIDMVVSLKVPDATAATALQTLQKIGFGKIKNVKRDDYYNFLVDGDAEKFRDRICKVDILVNANKHSCDFSIKKDNCVKILVQNIDDDCSGLLSTLKNRLGFKDIKKVEKGILWSLEIDAGQKEAENMAVEATKSLLINEHYQSFRVI